MDINAETISKLERLAYLQLDPEVREQLRGDLGKILDFANQLSNLPLSHANEMTHASNRENVLRQDCVQPSLPRSVALQNAPESDGEFILVPKVLD